MILHYSYGMEKLPTYGTSLHYAGELGEQYLDWQDKLGVIGGVIDSRKFSEYDFSDSVVLDFGCGAGNLLHNLNCKLKIGVEVNIAAHPKIIAKGIQVSSTLEEIDSDSVDIVISHHSMEHVPFPILALREIRRVLRASGSLILWVPIDDWRTQRKYDPDDINHHLNTWTPQLLGNSLREANFEVDPEAIRVVSHAWFPGYEKFYTYPGFNLGCKVYSFLRHRKQICAVVKPKN